MPGMDDDKVVRVTSGIKIDLSQPITEFVKMATISEQSSRRVKASLKSINEATLPNLAAQVANLQARIKLENISSNTLRAQVQQHAQAVKELQRKVALEGALTEQHKEQVRQLQMQQKILSAQVSEAAAIQRSTLSGQLTSMAARRASWFITGTAMFGLSAGLRQVIDDVADVEMRMISLARVMEDPLFSIEKMRTDLFALGQEFGFSFQAVQDIALRWAQAGYDAAETLELTRASLLALNTAEMNAEQATQSLIGIMAQWGIQADQLITIIDKLNLVADEYAVTTQDLVDGLLRSSGAARAAGMTFEQTLALLTAMRETSGRTGREVGNALNSIIAYVQRAKSLNVLSEAGIPVFANPEGTQLRNVFDILADISEKWTEMEQRGLAQALMEEAEAAGLFTQEIAEAAGALEEWTDLQRRDILQAGAGVYRRNYLLALLTNFTQVYDVLNTQERALGYSQRENERTMQAYTKQVASLKAEFQELAYALAAEGGMLDFLKTLVGLLREGADAFNRLPQPVKNTVMALAVLGTSVALLNTSTKLMAGVTIPEAIRAMGGWRGMMDRLYGATNSVVAALGGIGPATAKLLPVVAILSAVAYGLYRAAQYVDRYQKAFDKLTSEHADAMKTLEAELKVHTSNIEMLMRLGDQYRALAIQREEALSAGDTDAANAAYDKQIAILGQVEDALGREAAARLKVAEFSEEAANEIIEHEKAKTERIRQEIEEQLKAYRDGLRQQRDEILKALDETERAMNKQFTGFLDAMKTTFQNINLGEIVAFGFKVGIANVKLAFLNLFEWIADRLEEFVEKAAAFLRELPMEGAQQLGWRISATYGEGLRMIKAVLTSEQSKISRGLDEEWEKMWQKRRQDLRSLLSDIQTELTEGTGSSIGVGDGGGYFGQQQEELGKRIRSVVDAIIAEVEAIGLLDKAIERHMNILEERIAYYTREGASLQELQQADRDRAELMDLLRQRQEMLHRQAEAARQAYADLEQQIRSTFGQVFDLSTPEGRAGYFALSDDQRQAYDALADAMEKMLDVSAKNGVEWWRIQRQLNELAQENNAISRETIRLLGELSDAYGKGLLSLDAYLDSLARLEQQAGLSAEAVKRLNEEQAKALKEKWLGEIDDSYARTIAEIESEIERVNDELKQTVDNLDRIFDGFDRVTRQMDRAATRTNLLTAYNAFMGVPTRYSAPDRTGIEALARQALGGFGLFDVASLGVLSPDDFERVMQYDLDSLRKFSITAKDYLKQVSGYAQQRLAEIEDEMRRIDAWYERRIAELQAQLDALEAEEKADERAKAEEEYNKRIKALEEERQWILLQNEEDAAFRIAAIDAQLAKERAAWSEQLTKWQREDQKERIRNEMEELRQRRDAMMRDLEEQRRAVQEQQRLMTDLLNAVLEVINAEIEARREATEDYKTQLEEQAEARVQDLEDTKSWLEEKRKALDENWAAVLADMAAREPEFYARGQAIVERIIDGINSRKRDLETAISELNSIVSRVRSGASVTLPSLSVGGGGPVYAMAEGAYVRGGRGGVLSWIGEGPHDEIVFPVPKITPIMADAMRQVMATSSGLLGDLPRAVASAVQKALANTSFYGAFDITLPDGTVERQVIRVFSGLTPHVRTS